MEVASHFPNHITGTDTFGSELICKLMKVLRVAQHYYVNIWGRTQIQTSPFPPSSALQANLQEKNLVTLVTKGKSQARA